MMGALLDGGVLLAAYVVAYLLRFDLATPRWGWGPGLMGFGPVLLIGGVALGLTGAWRVRGRTVTFWAVPRFTLAAALLVGVLLGLRALFPADEAVVIRPPIGVSAMTGVLALMGWLSVRYVQRVQLRPIEVVDLLGRSEAEVGTAAVLAGFRGKRVLITGAGGSIGGELARQVLAAAPARLVLLDVSEAALYQVMEQLPGDEAVVRAVVGDCGRRAFIRAILAEEQPEVVLHAAAYKHVPMMEANPGEALRNNAFASRILAEEARRAGVSSFVLISTDKAIRPISAMGRSKRLAEILVRDLAEEPGPTRFCAVRFGNVLESSGSVVPKFRRQIAAGGPVTVTDARMVRYFMTLSEAVGLVLQAALLAKGGEIFVLDMGEPMAILALAETMIRLSGLRPYVDIPIVFSGTRPGEKLAEELGVRAVQGRRTEHARIFIGQIAQLPHERVKALMETIDKLLEEVATITVQDLATLLKDEGDQTHEVV